MFIMFKKTLPFFSIHFPPFLLFFQVNTKKKDTEGLLKSYEKQQRGPRTFHISRQCALCGSGWNGDHLGGLWWLLLTSWIPFRVVFLGAVNLRCKTKVEKMKWSWFFWGLFPFWTRQRSCLSCDPFIPWGCPGPEGLCLIQSLGAG